MFIYFYLFYFISYYSTRLIFLKERSEQEKKNKEPATLKPQARDSPSKAVTKYTEPRNVYFLIMLKNYRLNIKQQEILEEK